MIKIKFYIKTLLIICTLLMGIEGISFADNVIGDVPVSSNENRTVQRENTLYTGSCGITQDLAFYAESPVYLRVGQPKGPASYVFDKTKTYVRGYNQSLFAGNLKFPYVSNFVPSETIDTDPSDILTVDATGAVFSGGIMKNMQRKQIAGQIVTYNNERSIVQNANGSTLNYYYVRANDLSIHNGTLKVIINPSLTTKISCTNYYIARCGDGIVDNVSTGGIDGNGGIIPQGGTIISWHPMSIKPNEACDDGGAAGGCKDNCSGTGDGPTGQLVVNKTVVGGTTNFVVGNDVQFRIDFNNQSNQTINNVKIEDVLPAGLSYVSSQIYGATNAVFSTGMSGGSMLISYTGFSLSSGQNGYVLINTKMNICTSSTNFVFWEGGAWKGFSSAIADCQSTAELTFTKTMTKYNLVPGDTAMFTIRVSNNLSKVMSNVVVEDIWPSTNGCITMIPGTAVPATSNNTWSFGTLNPSDSKQITFNGKISNDSSCAGSYVNTAKITYTTDGTNKTATAIARFIIESVNQNVSIIKTRIGDEPVGLGSDVIFEIEYTNIGDTDIVGFKVTDMLSPAFKYKTSSIRSGLTPVLSPNGYQNPLVWDFGSQILKAKTSGKIRLTVTIK